MRHAGMQCQAQPSVLRRLCCGCGLFCICSRIRVKPSDLQGLVAHFFAQELVNICWACAKLGYHPGPLLQEFTQQIGRLVRRIARR